MATLHTILHHPRGGTTTSKNSGATVRRGGNADTTNGPVTNVPSITETNANLAGNGSIVPAPNYTTRSTFPPITAGTFAFQAVNTTDYLIRRINLRINGTASNILRFGASEWAGVRGNGIHRFRSDRRTRLSGWEWDNSNEGPLVYTATRNTWNTPFADDTVALPTRAIPGEFTFRDGRPNPGNFDLSARTG